ncbi:MAG: hypothetical protein HY744_28710 [Deltaproteobacteria bacterium]|nr:hypothetical protein [Deltaproteobacteria bacterium]
MSEPGSILVLFEGDDDRQVLRSLQGAGLLPASLRPSEQRSGGLTGLVRDAMPLLRQGGRALVLRDLDDMSRDGSGAWLEGELQREAGSGAGLVLSRSMPPPAASVQSGPRTGRVAAVAAGLPDDEDLRKAYVLGAFTMDDYLLRLARIPEVWAGVSECRPLDHALALCKLAEVAALLVQNGLPRAGSKQLLLYLRGIARFEVSPAEFARRFIDAAQQALGRERLRALFQPLVGDLQTAATTLRDSNGRDC